MLKVKKLHPDAKLPTVAHFGDLAYDLYSLEDTVLKFNTVTSVRTGLAAQAYAFVGLLGLLIRDRSSMASRGINTSGGVIDAGYTGEISVLMTNQNEDNHYTDEFGALRPRGYNIKAGDKIAQMIPIPVLTGEVIEVEELRESSRGDSGFGSTGR